MQIDTASFLILTTTLAAGGAGGYFASERHVFGPPPAPPAPPKESAAALPPPPPVSVAPPPAPPPPPPCGDMVGAPAACPPPGWPAEEGGCGGYATKRCEDFKKALKPHVAERAVACINALNPAQRCDPNRLELCGHSALMGACSVDEVPEPADAAVDELGAHCAAITRECEDVPLGPTVRDCRATLAGMSVLGRDRMVACMKTHCSDRGLLFCEGVIDVK